MSKSSIIDLEFENLKSHFVGEPEKPLLFKIDYSDIANLTLDEFWDKFSTVYQVVTDSNNQYAEMVIPIEDINWGMIQNEPMKDMWLCSIFNRIKIIRLFCGYLGDVYVVSSEDGKNSHYFKSKNLGVNHHNTVKHLLDKIYFSFRDEIIKFMGLLRFNVVNDKGLNVKDFENELIDIRKFIERNAEKYGILYHIDENSEMIIDFIKDEWI
jgi:hypothetical protein